MKTRHTRTRWAPLLALTAILAGCGPAVTPTVDAPAPAPTPAPAEPLATCGDSAIRLLDRGAGIHGAIVADTLHMGGAEAPVTCADPANLSLLTGLSIPDDYTAQAQQSQYYLIVIRYTSGNRLYVISRRADGSTCIVDTNDRCIAQVTELPEDFDLDDLPDDVAPTIPAGRPAPELPATTAPAAAGNPQPRDGATGVAVETLLLSWSAAARAASYEVYWGREEHLTADADLGTPIATTSTATTIRRPALGTTYYWRVDTKNDQGTTRGSVWSFTTADQAAPPPPGGGYTPPVVSPPPAATGTPPGAASTPQPRDGATGVAVETLLLSWSAAARAASYDVYWGTGRNLAADADLGTPIGATFTATTIRRPALGTTYYWRVDAKNDQGTTTGSVWSFTTADRAAPPPVTPGGGYTPPVVSPPPAEPPPAATSPPETVRYFWPRNGKTGVTVFKPELSWRRAARARSYEVYWGTARNLAADADLGTPIRTRDNEVNLRRPSATAAGQLLSPQTTYYWRVDATNEAGVTRGNVWSFTTREAPDVIVSFSQDHYSFAEEGENFTEEVLCPPELLEPICKFAYTEYTFPMEWSGPHLQVHLYASESDGTARGQGEGPPYRESDRKDYYRPGRRTHNPIGPRYNYIIRIIQDDKAEDDETFHVHIRPSVVLVPGTSIADRSKVIACARCSATITIIDND